MDELSLEEEQLLERWLLSEAPIDVGGATRALKEARQIWESFGITLFLMSGTCLGAIRDKGIIPWDDDVDIGSVSGLHGFTMEDSLEEVVAALRSSGFLTKMYRYDHILLVPAVKYSAKVSWAGFEVIDSHVEQYPSLYTPVSLFTDLKEISFLDERFYVPNPPEEYLRLKYGDEWRLPKKAGEYEKDIVNQVIANWLPEKAGGSEHPSAGHFPSDQTCRIRVLNDSGDPAVGAQVIVIGLGSCETDRNGHADFRVPQDDFYPVVIRHGDQERIDYFPKIAPGQEYIYRMNE